MSVETTITMLETHPHHPTKCSKGSQHKILNSYSNGFDIRLKKENNDYVMPYIQVFIPRNKCSISQKVV